MEYKIYNASLQISKPPYEINNDNMKKDINLFQNEWNNKNETEWRYIGSVPSLEFARYMVEHNKVHYMKDGKIYSLECDPSDVNVDGSSNYANNVGRIDGRNAMILVSNPNPAYQWPVTNSGNRNIFLDFGSYVQFFVDTVNNSLYVRSRDSVDMGNWGEIATKNELTNTFGLTRVDEHTCTFDLSSLRYQNNGLCLITLMGNSNLEGSAICAIGYFNGWRIEGLTTLIDAGGVGTITASISGSTLTVSNTGVNYSGKLSVKVGELFNV